MNASDRLLVLFAHHDEFLPAEFHDFPTPQNRPISQLSERQLRKWKSQRMAYFLLDHIFEQYALDKTLLKNILRTESGRPYIKSDQIDFNISHSGEWVAIIFAISKNKKMVGIDIEHPQKTRRYLDLLAYYAKPQEIIEIQNKNILPQLTNIASRFYLSWCLREAVLKSQGVGIIKLSEVKHSLSQQTIHSSHCPTGKLCFHADLPFYLAYFFEQSSEAVQLPPIFQWKNKQCDLIEFPPTLIYQVN